MKNKRRRGLVETIRPGFIKRAASQGKPAGRRLGIESLEARCLLAGDTYLINFTFDEAAPVTRYLKDSGAVYGDRGDGLSYGWSVSHTDVSRERNVNPDQRLDTLIHFHAGATWEFGLPNGKYDVTVAIGDPGASSAYTLNVEGVNYWNGLNLAADTFATKTMTVTVSDGRLTLDQGAAPDKATRIDYIQIVNVPSGPNATPATPTITEPSVDGKIVNPADVHMEAGGFSDADGNAHKSTDWEIWTVGAGAEPVWQTLGIEGIQTVHTHLGDGVFMNSRAGQITLAGNTDYELRVRFRDDAGSVSAYATRTFHTTPASATNPLVVQDVAASPAATWTDIFDAAVDLPGTTGLLTPGGPIIAVDADGASSSPGNESVENAIDGTLAKYLNFGETNSGFIVTPGNPAAVVTSFRITTANDSSERDPATWQLYGTNDPVTSGNHSTGTAESWTLIASGSVSLPTARNTLGPIVSVSNSTAYKSYKMLFPTVRNAGAANSMQIAEIQFFGNAGTVTPPSLRLEDGATGDPLWSATGTDAPGNTVVNPPALANHAEVRAVLQAGTNGLSLGQTNLTFTDDDGAAHTIYLPIVSLGANERLDLWVADDGSTYYGTAGQTAPEFSMLARPSESSLTNPFVPMQPGYVVEQVGSDYRLPVNIAFVPNPGPSPTDPLYYVTELYGSIQVVLRNGTKQTFASGLLDYNPQGPISGTGEQGLTGIAVQRDAVNPEIYHLYVGMLWDNGSPPGGLVHYPKVERIDSTAGGLTMASRTLLLNMQPETQGQSHQISNVSIGPDGKLYVHNGDGFDATKGQDLNSFKGKVLRMNLDGTPATDNPFYNAANGITATDYIYAYGFRNPFGGDWRAADGKQYEVENGPSVDRLAQVNRGVNYGYNGSDASMRTNAIYNWDVAHAPVNMAFVQQATFGGSRFPTSKMDHLFVSESGPTYATGPQGNGKRIVEFVLDGDGNRVSGPTTLVEYRGTGQGTVVGLAAGPDGLYFTEMYEDTGANGPTAAGARIFRVRYIGQATGDFDYSTAVDGADFLKWQRTLGSVVDLNADAERSGIVDGADLTVWQNAYPSAGAEAAAGVGGDSIVASAALVADDATTTPNGAALSGLATDGRPGELHAAGVPGSKEHRSWVLNVDDLAAWGEGHRVRDWAFVSLGGGKAESLRDRLLSAVAGGAGSDAGDVDEGLPEILDAVFGDFNGA
jgi:glucose/arabinose dehydrogenase